MNRTIRNLVIAVPLATVGLTVVNTGAAIAGPNGPVVIGQPDNDPEPPGPQDKAPLPQPKGPQDKAPLPQPKGPQDKAPKPQAQPQPGTGTAAPAEAEKTEKAEKKAKTVVSAKGSPDSIDRSNLFASDAFETELVVAEDTDGGLDLTWLLVGGGVVTATGLAFAARKRANA